MFDEVWTWYQVTREALSLARRRVHEAPETVAFGPGRLRSFASADDARSIVEGAVRELEDLAVLALFASFEAALLEHSEQTVTAMVRKPKGPLQERLLAHWLREHERIPLSSVLDLYKAVLESDAVGLVKQVQQYRNWVAHGKRKPPPPRITPIEARERLADLLRALP